MSKTSKKVLMVAVYLCLQCEQKTSVQQQGIQVKAPIKCSNCSSDGPFRLLTSESTFATDDAVASNVR